MGSGERCSLTYSNQKLSLVLTHNRGYVGSEEVEGFLLECVGAFGDACCVPRLVSLNRRKYLGTLLITVLQVSPTLRMLHNGLRLAYRDGAFNTRP